MACWGRRRSSYVVLVGRIVSERDNVEYLGVDGNIILKWTLKIGWG
jgi:hypothetical protein